VQYVWLTPTEFVDAGKIATPTCRSVTHNSALCQTYPADEFADVSQLSISATPTDNPHTDPFRPTEIASS
jgi:hypothetical protein